MLWAGAAPARAQGVAETAVTRADDAFGLSLGRESIGLYSSRDVRGFSAVDAGNVRLDGLYFDAVALPSRRLQRSSAIRVGIAAQGHPFPAPTGVVDFALRRPGNEPKASIYVSADSLHTRSGELDAEVPVVRDTLGVGFGLASFRENFHDGTSDRLRSAALVVRWRPTPAFELLPFWSRLDTLDAQAAPLYITAGGELPPPLPRQQFDGPDWARSRTSARNVGGIARWTPSDAWEVRAGLFRSSSIAPIGFANLYVGLTPDGRARQWIIVDPPASHVSTSGELRVSHVFADGERRHRTIVSLRSRTRERLYGGSAEIDLGEVRIAQPQTAPRPAFGFGERERDRIGQRTLGIAHEVAWKDLAQLSLGIQRTGYTKRVALADGTALRSHSSPYLASAAGSVQATPDLAFYAGYAGGLEDSGSAPDSAVNRNEPLPAIRTRQLDAGLRWTPNRSMKLVAGVFDLRKPYYQLDAAQRYALLGTNSNRGVEISLSGAATPQLDVVAGVVLSAPRVSGPVVDSGLIGREPVDKPRVRLVSNLEWRPSWLAELSLEAGITHVARRAATTDNAVHVQGRTLLDVGARYATRIAGWPARWQLSVTNVGDAGGVELYGAGVYGSTPGTAMQLGLAIDL